MQRKFAMEQKIFGLKIQQAIDSSGVKKGELANFLGVSTQALRNWMNGDQVPNALQIAIIADKTQKKLAWFYDFENKIDNSENVEAVSQKTIVDNDRLISLIERQSAQIDKHQEQIDRQLTIIESLTSSLNNALSLDTTLNKDAKKVAGAGEHSERVKTTIRRPVVPHHR